MNLKKILAVAAVTLLAVPALAAATNIVVPPVPEQVVEGHTVFTVIEKARFRNATLEAAAVAVLVREREQVRDRFKGVLWFNDQFLVSPEVQNANITRHPCGGAVIAVNSGDPDPRTKFVSVNGQDLFLNATENAQYANDYHMLDVTADPATPAVGAQTNAPTGVDAALNDVTTLIDPTLAPFQYVESYLITDPNDHVWIVDKYEGVTMMAVEVVGASQTFAIDKYPLWVVNILGKPVFTPDVPNNRNCAPFVDDPFQQSLIYAGHNAAANAVCDTTTTNDAPDNIPDSCPYAGPGLGTDTNGDSVPADGLDMRPPSIGYYEPTDTSPPAPAGSVSYCYDGNPAPAGTTPGFGCAHPGVDNSNPLRKYNAVLFFYLGPNDVIVTGTAPHAVDDTNGCQVYTEWRCPADNDDKEGYSHPFNPPGVWVPSTSATGAGGYFDVHQFNRDCSTGYYDSAAGICNPEEHLTHNRGLIDIYFSPTGRPFEPPVRNFVILDYEGSTDQFHENDDTHATMWHTPETP